MPDHDASEETTSGDADSGDANRPTFVAYGLSPGAFGIGSPVHQPAESTPLESATPVDDIPPAPLWAMRARRHFHLTHRGDPVSSCIGTGDEAVFVIDDGAAHCMIGRRVGSSDDGCIYCLVARIARSLYDRLASGEVSPSNAFSEAHDLSLSGVFDDETGASNVIPVREFADPADVPRRFLPPASFIRFGDVPPSGER
jgi:hypothetical protein